MVKNHPRERFSIANRLSGNFIFADSARGRICLSIGAGAVIWVDTSPASFVESCFGRDAGRFNGLGLRRRHELHPQAAGFALQGGEVALLPALLKFRGAAVKPKLPLCNQPIV